MSASLANVSLLIVFDSEIKSEFSIIPKHKSLCQKKGKSKFIELKLKSIAIKKKNNIVTKINTITLVNKNSKLTFIFEKLLKSKSIITNKNKILIAPTYITKIKNPKYSIPIIIYKKPVKILIKIIEIRTIIILELVNIIVKATMKNIKYKIQK